MENNNQSEKDERKIEFDFQLFLLGLMFIIIMACGGLITGAVILVYIGFAAFILLMMLKSAVDFIGFKLDEATAELKKLNRNSTKETKNES